MLSRLSIAKKIFGLAVLLLCLTVVLACFLLWHVSRLQDEMEAIAQREAPLAAALSKLDEYGLRRRLAFWGPQRSPAESRSPHRGSDQLRRLHRAPEP